MGRTGSAGCFTLNGRRLPAAHRLPYRGNHRDPLRHRRSVEGILAYIRRLGARVGAHEKAEAYAQKAERHIADIRAAAVKLRRRPKVYFEEWEDPLISGIRWVAELIVIAGGDDCFPELAREPLAKQRILPNGDEVVRRAPDIILGSWCGKRFRPERVAARPGWDMIPAVRNGDLHEIKSPIILQPGPAAVFDGLDALHRIISAWAQR
jgi:iron complex transport system substrate-binding protein